MVGMDPEQAARDLAEADQRLRRGAKLVAPPRWWKSAFGLYFVMLCAKWDIPPSVHRWYGLLLLVVISVLVVSMVRARTRARARPLPMPLTWRAWLLAGAVAITSYAVVLGGGAALRTVGVPLPFTLSGLVVVSALSLLKWSGQRWGGSYLQRVSRGEW